MTSAKCYDSAFIMFEDQVVPVGSPPPGVPEWQVQSRVVENFKVNHASNEWRYWQQKFLVSLPQAEIHEMIRIQNKWIWQQYVFERKRLYDKNMGAINEMELFHGCGGLEPLLICNSMEGFDMRHSKGGRWGSANYFASTAQYADRFAHTVTANNLKEVIIAKVVLGDVYDCGTRRDDSLRFPPVKEAHDLDSSLQNIRYDSVSGITKNTRVYMTYDNRKAYPAYIIKYRLARSR